MNPHLQSTKMPSRRSLRVVDWNLAIATCSKVFTTLLSFEIKPVFFSEDFPLQLMLGPPYEVDLLYRRLALAILELKACLRPARKGNLGRKLAYNKH